MPPFNRSLPALRRRYGRPFLICLFLIIFLDAIIITNSYSPSTPQVTPPTASSAEKIFISSIFRNNEYMLRLHWSSNILKLIQHLGPQNVYVSIVESGSQEDTKGALVDLQNSLNALGVANRIELGETVDEQAESLLHVPEEGSREGWIFTGRKKIEGGWEVRRIPYLAKLRNKAMEPLEMLQKEGKVFEKVLWINDVIFTTEDVTTLLNTNHGHYAAACSFDFSHAPHYYDTFALRDASGYTTASLTFPYFYSPVSRSALISSPGEIPVQSCWNGMIAFDAQPFYPTPEREIGLKFRGVSDDLAKQHVEGSECCLIHADNPLSSSAGVYLNANVRVAYNEPAYTYANPGAVFSDTGEGFARKVEWPHGRGRWPGRLEMVVGTWGNRLSRWMGGARLWSDRGVVEWRVGKWMRDGAEEREVRREAGIMCLINEMQVLFENGWQHV